ncbi:ribonuclease P protein component, partial [Nocardia puris]|uniref:ribonuclease P protein component n=1 Tax=Nocardia puris TaxID=208602 RepID=UPI00397FB619
MLGCWTQHENARLGVIVARKNIARATQRNRIKRHIREAFRIRKTSLAVADLVVLVRKELQFLENRECQSHFHD